MISLVVDDRGGKRERKVACRINSLPVKGVSIRSDSGWAKRKEKIFFICLSCHISVEFVSLENVSS